MKKKLLSRVFTLVMALLILGSSLCANAAFTIPEHGLLVDDSNTTIKASAMRAGQIAPMILGANLVATSNLGALQDVNTSNPNSLLGMFGSDVNSNPDPYLYNYFFNNAYAGDNRLQTIAEATSAVSQLDGTGQTPDVIITVLENRPDLILAQGAGMGSAAANESYVSIINTLPENVDEAKTNDYNPSYYTCSISSLVYQCENLKNLAQSMKTIMLERDLTARYGDPTVIASDYDKYVWGTYFYIAEQIATGAIAKKSVAIVTATEDNGATWTMPKRATDVAQNKPNRLVEYCRDNTELLSDTLGASASLKDILACDVVVAVGKGDILKQAAEAAGIKESELPVIFDKLPNCLYGMTMQTHENALGIPYLQSFIYADELEINPAYFAAYFYQKFFHVTDDKALQEAVEVLLSGASLPDGFNADLSKYNPKSVESVITKGVSYAQSTGGKRHDDPEAWNPDMTIGIGSSGATADKYVSAVCKAFHPDPSNADLTPVVGTPIQFSDVSAKESYASAVDFVTARGYFKGTSDTTFSPDASMTRGMFVTVMCRIVDAEATTATSKFTDVAADAYFAPGVAWATEAGVVKGVSETLFAPDEEVTLEQALTFLFRLTEQRGVKMNDSYTPSTALAAMADYNKVSSWALNEVNWASNAHLVSVDGTGLLNPQEPISRAEIAVILARYITG